MSHVEIGQKLGVRGDIEIRVIDDSTGELVRRVEVRNMIMTSGMQLIGQLLAGYATPATDSRKLAWIYVGIGTTPPAAADTLATITNPAVDGGVLVACPVTTTVSVAGTSVEVKCTATLPSGAGAGKANGANISEAGLVSVDATAGAVPSVPTAGSPALFARQIFPAVPKNSALSILFDWRITFTA